MEAINTVGMVRKLADCKNIELQDGQMLARKIEKGTGKDSLAVVIAKPDQETFVVALENNTILQAAYDWYLGQVESSIKGKMLEQGNILPEDYSIDSVAAFIEAENVREGRISKERIEQWFNSSVASTLQAAFAAKLGTQWTDDKCKAVTAAYRDTFKLLAKREIVLADLQKQNLSKVIELLPDSGMVQFCKAKIADSSEKAADLLGL